MPRQIRVAHKGGERLRLQSRGQIDFGGWGDLEDLREAVHWAVAGICRGSPAAEGAVAAVGGVRPAYAHNARAKCVRCIKDDGLGAVVVAAGEGVVVGVGSIRAVVAGLVPVVGFVVPVPVVEVRVVVGYLVAIQPVDGDAVAGGAGVVAGVDGSFAADGSETRAVFLDGCVAVGGSVLHECVVVRDIGGGGVALRGREEDEAELGAGVQASGDEVPVIGDLGCNTVAGA